jgi:hypothetical protein
MTADELQDPARRRLAFSVLTAPLAFSAAAAQVASGGAAQTYTGRWVHAFAAYGPPALGSDFTHFGYVNPQAPKGGTLRLKNPDRRSSFDKYNPWTTRGNAPAGVLIWMVESLGHLAQDEPMTVYGLLAEAMNVASDFGSVDFRLRPQARFNNGDAVTAEDVRHSWAMLASPGAAPNYQTLVAGIAAVQVLDSEHRALRFSRQEPRAGLRRGHDAGVLAQMGRRQDDGPDRHRAAHHQRPVPDRQDRHATAHRVPAEPTVLGQGSGGAPGALQLRARGVPQLHRQPDRAGSLQGRRVRPHQGIPLAHLGAPARGCEVGRRAHPESRHAHAQRLLHAVVQPEHAPAAVPGHSRARGAGLHLRLRDAQQDQGLHARQQRLQQLRVRRRGPARPGASWRCWSPSAPNCRRGFSARPSSHHAPTPSRWRCAATCSRHASC